MSRPTVLLLDAQPGLGSGRTHRPVSRNREFRILRQVKKTFYYGHFLSNLGSNHTSAKEKDMHPVNHWHTRKSENRKMNSSVQWNFQKFMVNPDGSLEGKVSTRTKPFDPVILEWIEGK